MIQVGDRVKVGPRICGCKPSTGSRIFTVTKVRPVRPHKRLSECHKCAHEYEIDENVLIAELDDDARRYPVSRLTVVKRWLDKRLLLV